MESIERPMQQVNFIQTGTQVIATELETCDFVRPGLA